MASFAQEQPTAQEPNFAFWAKPISQPRPNLTGEAIAKGLSAVTGAAIEGSDFLAKRDIDNRVHSGLDKEVAEKTSLLDATEESLLSGKEPPFAKDLNDRLGKLKLAMNETGIGSSDKLLRWAEQSTIAKDVRSQWPGYRDYIDQMVARHTNLDPANLEFRRRVAELNANLKEKNAEDKVLKRELINAGMPHILEGVEKGTITRQKAEQLLAEFHEKDIAYRRKVQEYELGDHKYRTEVVRPFEEERMNKQREDWEFAGQKRKRDERSLHAIDATSDRASNMFKQDLDQMLAASGFKNLDDFVDGVGKRSREEQDNLKYVMGLRAAKAKIALVQEAMKDFPGMDPEIANKIVDHALAPYEELFKHIGSDSNYAKAQKLEDEQKDADIWRGMTKADPRFNNARILRKELGPENAAFLIGPLMKEYTDPKKRGIMMGITSNSVLNPQANLENELEGIEKSNESDSTKSLLYLGIIGQVANIEKLNDAGAYDPAAALADKFYGPKSGNVVDKFNRGKDQAKAYSKLYADSVTDSMWALKNRGHAGVWNEYGTSLKESFKRFAGTEINTLNRIHEHEKVSPRVRGEPSFVTQGFTVSWDSDKHLWELHSKIPPEKGIVSNWMRRQEMAFQASVSRLNEALSPVKYYAGKQGKDVNQFVIQFMLDSGMDPKSRGFTIPEQLLRSVTTAGTKIEKPE